MTLAALLAFALSASAAPAAAPRAAVLPGDEVELRSADGWALKGVWLKAEAGKPTVLLLHGTGQRKEDWRLFARALSWAGDGYLALDLRGHGESRVNPAGETVTWKKLRVVRKGPNDYEDMVRDAEAAVAYLAGQGVPEESIGVVGAEVGGSVGVKYAAVHPRTPFVVLLSPGLDWQDVPIVNAVRAFKGRATPILMVHSEADKRSSKETPLLHTFAKLSVGERAAALFVVPEERGTRLFAKNKGLAERVAAWIADPLPPEAPAVSTAAVEGSTVPAADVETVRDEE